MYFRLRVRYQVERWLAFTAAEARQKGMFLHRMLDVELRRALADVVVNRGVQTVVAICIVPPPDVQSSYDAGETFEFDVNVFSGTQEALAVMVSALFGLERMGREASQSRMRLSRISAVMPCHLPRPLYDADEAHGFIDLDVPALSADDLCVPIDDTTDALVLETVTPLIITTPAKRRLNLQTEAPKLGRLVRGIMRRCREYWPDALCALTRQMPREELEALADKLDRSADAISHETAHAPSLQYKSSKHDNPLQLEGYVGRIIVHRDWQALLPVLRVGSWMQAGQKTTMGFGVYRLTITSPIMQ